MGRTWIRENRCKHIQQNLQHVICLIWNTCILTHRAHRGNGTTGTRKTFRCSFCPKLPCQQSWQRGWILLGNSVPFCWRWSGTEISLLCLFPPQTPGAKQQGTKWAEKGWRTIVLWATRENLQNGGIHIDRQHLYLIAGDLQQQLEGSFVNYYDNNATLQKNLFIFLFLPRPFTFYSVLLYFPWLYNMKSTLINKCGLEGKRLTSASLGKCTLWEIFVIFFWIASTSTLWGAHFRQPLLENSDTNGPHTGGRLLSWRVKLPISTALNGYICKGCSFSLQMS